MRAWGFAALLSLSAWSARAKASPPEGHDAPPPSEVELLGERSPGLVVESVTMRVSGYNQYGTGYQSKSGPLRGPGSERLTVFQPQTEIVVTQGDRLTHRLWIPVDVISSASPNRLPKPADIVTGASRHNFGGSLQWTATYRASTASELSMTNGLRLEEPFRSWNSGLGLTRAFADQNTVLSGRIAGIVDWFDRFFTSGARNGRAERSTATGSVGLTQVLGPTTLANVNYGLTVQSGELGNTWNAVPLADGTRGAEILPRERVRHAAVGRLSQFLPWNGALRLYYRFYADDWGTVAHSAEGDWMQRVGPTLYVGALYRFHTQTGPAFYRTLAAADGELRVADSDLAPLQSQTIGGKIVGDVPLTGVVHRLHYEFEYDRYARSNDLRMDIVTCAVGLHF